MSENISENSEGNSPLSGVKRKYRNMLLKPGLQTLLGIYLITLSLLFATSIGFIVYANFSELVDVVLTMTEAQEEVRDIFQSYWEGTQIYLYAVFLVYLLASIGVTIWYTHHLVGPTIAFRRHILALAEGKYNARTNLRKGDAFEEVADALNSLSETLESKKK